MSKNSVYKTVNFAQNSLFGKISFSLMLFYFLGFLDLTNISNE